MGANPNGNSNRFQKSEWQLQLFSKLWSKVFHYTHNSGRVTHRRFKSWFLMTPFNGPEKGPKTESAHNLWVHIRLLSFCNKKGTIISIRMQLRRSTGSVEAKWKGCVSLKLASVFPLAQNKGESGVNSALEFCRSDFMAKSDGRSHLRGRWVYQVRNPSWADNKM